MNCYAAVSAGVRASTAARLSMTVGSDEDGFAERSHSPSYTPIPRVQSGADGRTSNKPGTPPEKAPDQEFGSGVIDQARYTSTEFMRLEWERVWTKVWLLAGRELDMPEVGDFLVTEIGIESVLVVRQPDRTFRAFYNVCQHRGNRLRPCGLGKAGESQSFKCMYHHCYQ